MGTQSRVSRGLAEGNPSMARSWRFVAPIVMTGVLITQAVGTATALTPVRHALLERHETVEQARAVRRQEALLERDLLQRIAAFERTSRRPEGPGARSEDVRVPATNAAIDSLLVLARTRLQRLDPWARHRLAGLPIPYRSLQSWVRKARLFPARPPPAVPTTY